MAVALSVFCRHEPSSARSWSIISSSKGVGAGTPAGLTSATNEGRYGMERLFWICLAGAAGTGTRYLVGFGGPRML